ncbi:peroxiredoxin [Dysgonomonas sp. BGC7]|uniref:peroxiredoxin family protein n=1 Tax=Dysgonomonas sp. BGC7 TaxID=1658008 RepID=UPI0006803F1E|nr:thioredoxin family protein [Dysgonomonas sp. BGC7]MBD8389782.1 redoxin domain-containing protein [Dysgonomonas sp. BGC7]
MMKIYRYIILSVCLVATVVAKTQTIKVKLPAEANKDYVLILNKGIKQDTIVKGHLSFLGEAVLNIPKKDAGYIGMGTLLINEGAHVNFIINNENFEVEQGDDKKYQFTHSRENEYLYSIMQNGAHPTDDTSLYAPHFVGFIRYMQALNRVSTNNVSLMEKANVRSYALDQLDMDRLYTSSIWYNVIDGIVRLGPDQESFGSNMVQIMKRIKSQEVFEHLADNLVTITEQYGWDDAFDIIVPYIQESGRIEFPQGKMYSAFSMAKVKKGTYAPIIDGLKTPLKGAKANKTLLVFYQPDCENCHIQLEKLIKNYSKLNQMGVRVVSLSSDHEKEMFEKDVKRFPWAEEDKLCDYKGFAGVNFINYGIMSTPTFFLLDKDSRVIKRYALFADIDFSSGISE